MPDRLRLLFLLPYSPELNPAEHLWDCIRENWFPTKTFNGLDAVGDTLVEELLTLGMDNVRVQGLTGLSWIINNTLNATKYKGTSRD